jgi:2-dehydro-3-deoxyphosphogluconate aldolase/(4S)-4-hydroxy-2-oxoglutarate aldolase
VTLESAPEYLELPSVVCVGGSWPAPSQLIERRDWKSIETLAAETAAALRAQPFDDEVSRPEDDRPRDPRE